MISKAARRVHLPFPRALIPHIVVCEFGMYNSLLRSEAKKQHHTYRVPHRHLNLLNSDPLHFSSPACNFPKRKKKMCICVTRTCKASGEQKGRGRSQKNLVSLVIHYRGPGLFFVSLVGAFSIS